MLGWVGLGWVGFGLGFKATSANRRFVGQVDCWDSTRPGGRAAGVRLFVLK